MTENEVEDGEGEKSSKKIIIIAAVVLLLAGGGAGYFFMAGDPVAGEADQTEDVVGVVEEEEGANEEVYYELEKALVVNFPRGSGASLIQVSITLLVQGQDTIDALKKHEPMIRNNLLMAISGQGSENLKTREGKEQLRAKMLDEIGKVMEKMTGQNKVSNLFFTTFVMQ